MNKKLILLCLTFTLSLSLCSCSKNVVVKDTNLVAASNSTKEDEDKDKKSYNNATEVTKSDEKNESKSSKIKLLKDVEPPENIPQQQHDWGFKPQKEDIPSSVPKNICELLNKYSGYYLGDTSKKVIYLTFDEGYENGYTSKILDILKNNNVKAAFFVTTPYVKTNVDLIKRMADEGHLVCNHSTHHPSMAKVAAKDKAKFEEEFTVLEKTFEDTTGKKMPKFFRPPMGAYSELSLFYTEKLGYKTIFWSSAYSDWDIKKQPSPEKAKKLLKERSHNGAIVLLHAVSKTNTEVLDSVIKDWKSRGYELQTLDKLP